MKHLSSTILTLAAAVALTVAAIAASASQPDAQSSLSAGETFTAPITVRIDQDEYYEIPAVFTITGPNTVMIGNGSEEAIFKRYSGTVIIPDSVACDDRFYTVTKIADNAFYGCSRLNAAEISNSVRTIGSAAFCGCLQLESITLPQALDTIANHAFHSDSHLRTLTLPSSLREIGDGAFTGTFGLCYVDARKAAALEFDSARGEGSPFADLSEQTIIYTPIGTENHDETNVIATDSLGKMSCSRLLVDIQEFSDAECLRGKAAHELNSFHGIQAFGQNLGTDRYPTPAQGTSSLVARVSYFVGNDLKCDDYVNFGKCVNSLPSPQSLGFTDSLAIFNYQSNGVSHAFTASTPITADITVYASWQSLPGHDGFLFEDSLTVTADNGMTRKIPAMFRVSSQAAREVTVGDGTYSAVSTTTSGTVAIPDSIRLDSLYFRVTGIADNAFASCSRLTAVQMPDSITHIGADALHGCSAITSLTLPAAVQTIGDRAFADCGNMKFIDMRRALDLHPDTIAPGLGMLDQCSPNMLVYAPRGFKAAAANVVTTDTSGIAACRSIVIGGSTFDSTACAAGAAAHHLNSYWKLQAFGQRLGIDLAPLPLAAPGETVHRIQFFNRDSLCVTAYANHGKTVPLPTPAALGLTTSRAELVYYVNGIETPFTDTTAVLSDLTVQAFPKAVEGENGYKFTHRVNYLDCDGKTLTCLATFTVTSYADRQLQLGDGRHNAVPIQRAKLFAVPDSIVIDSTAYRITQIAETAFCGCDSLQAVMLPAGITKVAEGAFKGCKTMRFVDMRHASVLSFADSASMAAVFTGISPEALLYLPAGHRPIEFVNAIATDSLGHTSCTAVTADRLTLSPEACASGAAAYLLNKWYEEPVFSQIIGTQACPVPAYADTTGTDICRVKFVTGFEVAHTAYTNKGGCVALPDTAALGLRTHHTLKFCTIAPDGSEQPFSADTKISADTAVWVKDGVIVGDINGDLAIDSTDVELLVNQVLKSDSTLTADERTASDIDANGTLDISDITALIDKTITPDTLPAVPDTRNKTENLNVIILGNSFACDAYFYVPFIMRNVAPKLKVSMHIFNQSGASLADQWDLLSGNKTYRSYHTYSGNGVWWSSGANQYSIADIIKAHRNSINLVLLQQGSALSASADTYQPYIDHIVHALKDSLGSHTEVGLLLTPAYPQGSWWLTTLGTRGLTSNEMHRLTADAARKTIGSSDVSLVIPAGTAIQNARTTALDTLGRFQYHHLSSDGMHLQDGAPCLIEGYVVAQTLLQHMHRSETIWDEKRTLPITQTWLDAVGAREVALPVQGMEPSNVEIVKRCVREALKQPFKITDCGQ